MKKIERAADRYHREILKQTESFTIVGYVPGAPMIRLTKFESLRAAKDRSIKLMEDNPRMRTVMLYASDQHERHVLVGSYDRELTFWPTQN